MFRRFLGRPALESAWRDVLAADAEDGTLQKGVMEFAGDLQTRLDGLHESLQNSDYEPADLREVRIPKSDGSKRLLHVPAVQDRVVERALLRGLTPLIDPHLGPAAFGYRPGLGVADAVQRVAGLRDEGHPWAVRTDVEDCFPSLKVSTVLKELATFVPDRKLLELIERLLARCATGVGGRHTFPGIPQGSPLSPVFSNLVLKHLDTAVVRAGYPMVRYADDVLIACRTENGARAALHVAERAIHELEMTLGTDKTEIMSFTEGLQLPRRRLRPALPADSGGPPTRNSRRRCRVRSSTRKSHTGVQRAPPCRVRG